MASSGKHDENVQDAEVLLDRLAQLAANYRGVHHQPSYQTEIIDQYHEVLQRLAAIGWQGPIDWDSELPNELMPPNYQYEQQQTNWRRPPPPRSFWQRLWDRLVGPPHG